MRPFLKRSALPARLLGLMLAAGAAAADGYLEPYQPATTAPPPAFVLPDLQGTPHGLGEYRGKVVMVNFWASWCLPCVEEMPSMQRLADALGPDRFQILAVNVGESPPRVRQFLKSVSVDFTVLVDRKSETFEDWSVRVLPTSFLLDPEGHVRHRALGPIDWDTKEMRELIREMGTVQ
jgi:thiol-disulfide isomerase/thioredoxin